nr:MAG TPA: hypothetical protein [Caudoviricetes sp.]
MLFRGFESPARRKLIGIAKRSRQQERLRFARGAPCERRSRQGDGFLKSFPSGVRVLHRHEVSTQFNE